MSADADVQIMSITFYLRLQNVKLSFLKSGINLIKLVGRFMYYSSIMTKQKSYFCSINFCPSGNRKPLFLFHFCRILKFRCHYGPGFDLFLFLHLTNTAKCRSIVSQGEMEKITDTFIPSHIATPHSLASTKRPWIFYRWSFKRFYVTLDLDLLIPITLSI